MAVAAAVKFIHSETLDVPRPQGVVSHPFPQLIPPMSLHLHSIPSAIFAGLIMCSCGLGDPDCLDVRDFERHISFVAEVFEDVQSGSFPEQYDQILYDFLDTLAPGHQYPAALFVKQLDLFGSPSAMKKVTTTPWGEIHFEFDKQMERDGKQVVYRVKLPVCDKLQGIDYAMRTQWWIRFEADEKSPGHWKIPRSMHDTYKQKRETERRWDME